MDRIAWQATVHGVSGVRHNQATFNFTFFIYGLPGSSLVKNLPANARDIDSIPGAGRSPGEETGNPP